MNSPNSPSTRRSYFAREALLPTGWHKDVLMTVADNGTFVQVTPAATEEPESERVGVVLPGMVNLHSHAFQRAMAGLAERRGPLTDSFWTWREVMYRFVEGLNPDDIAAITAQLYVELLLGGFTGVVEFHYLHRDPTGALYQNPAELALRIFHAAEQTGIGLTLLASLYQQGGFAAAPLNPRQRRFFLDDDEFATVLTELYRRRGAGVTIGIAPHSLRAVTPEALRHSIALLEQHDRSAPVHLHIAEQPAEVSACLAWSDKRPIAWLLDNISVDERFCLIHATHGEPSELKRLASTHATVGLCPSTEANLGDGIFAAADFLATDGRFGIGTDSHVGTCALEELRLLEYSQRLSQGRRCVLAPSEGVSTGTYLWQAAARGGAQAGAQPTGQILPGARADLVVLDDAQPSLSGRSGATLLDSAMFGPGRCLVSDVMVAGKWVVRAGRHFAQEAIATRFRSTLLRLTT
jgi:formimidoylglutamate deiminase